MSSRSIKILNALSVKRGNMHNLILFFAIMTILRIIVDLVL